MRTRRFVGVCDSHPTGRSGGLLYRYFTGTCIILVSVLTMSFFDTCVSSEERWRSEGIQPGGPRSLRGVVGTWFDKDHDPHGPAGPTAFWKVAELTDEEDDESDEYALWLH